MSYVTTFIIFGFTLAYLWKSSWAMKALSSNAVIVLIIILLLFGLWSVQELSGIFKLLCAFVFFGTAILILSSEIDKFLRKRKSDD